MSISIVSAEVEGPLLVCDEALSFWGGVDAANGRIVDQHHPQCGSSLVGQLVMMPTSRGSCSGSGVLLELLLAGLAPRALIFNAEEDILTLGAVVAERLFQESIAVVRLSRQSYARLARESYARIAPTRVHAGAVTEDLRSNSSASISLSQADHDVLAGRSGDAARIAMEIIVTMAKAQGARSLIDVSRAHIDGCIYAGRAFLSFAQTMAKKGAKVRIPTTMNAVSVNRDSWRAQGVAEDFGMPASQLAEAYLEMGAQPTLTCAPYLLAERPARGEVIAWAESNAVIYANSVLGAMTPKHADFMDLCIALTGRAAEVGVYLAENRAPLLCIDVSVPNHTDDAFWPLLGWLSGRLCSDRIPALRGLSTLQPSADDLKAMCAAFATTSAAPMLHIDGITAEASIATTNDMDCVSIDIDDFRELWWRFNPTPVAVDLIALGSPHFSASECRDFADLIESGEIHPSVTVMITIGPSTLDVIKRSGIYERLLMTGVKILSEVCWCTIKEPVFPTNARVLMTNSAKYAHYAPGLSHRDVRFGSLKQCADTARTGLSPGAPPKWICASDYLN